MSQIIETLMHEHRLIEQVLGSLETFVDQLDPGHEDVRRHIADYAEFFREFADRCHHGKEEDLLFEALGDHGFPRNAGPLFVMVGEHTMGRSKVGALASVGGGDGPLSVDELRTLRDAARSYIQLLRQHIQKEDGILFPAAERALPPEVLDGLAAAFERFESTAMGEGAHAQLHSLAERLLAEFPDVA